MKPESRRWFTPLASLLLASLLLTSSAPATASTETLKRSVSNIAQAPLDFVLAPMVGLLAVASKMREQDDPIGVRLAFAVPGVIWNTGVNIGSSVIRLVTGGLELVPGIFLLPFDAELDPLFVPVDNAAALVEIETPCCLYVKFGIDYTAAAY